MDKKFTMALIILIKLFDAVATTIYDPFLPAVGIRKHLTITQVGIIIGTVPVVIAIITPFVGKGIPIFGSTFTLITGSLLKGIFTIMFGMLINLPDGPIFFTMCTIEAVFLGLASAMTLNACNTSVTLFFPDRISPMQGLAETAYFIGLTAGPPIGGYLFSVGGYKTPFYVTGFAITTLATFAFIYFPSEDQQQQQLDEPLMALGKSLKMWILTLTMLSPSMIMICMNVLLPVYLQETLKVSVFHTGLILVARSGISGVSSLVVGYYYDIRWMKPLCITGLALLSASCLLVGPSPVLPWLPSPPLWLIILCLVGMGVANSCITTTMFENLLCSALEYGFTDNLNTYAKISIIFETAIASGQFIGPVLGGLLFDAIGYGWTVTVLSFILAIMTSSWVLVRK